MNDIITRPKFVPAVHTHRVDRGDIAIFVERHGVWSPPYIVVPVEDVTMLLRYAGIFCEHLEKVVATRWCVSRASVSGKDFVQLVYCQPLT